ncbi:hypothetical protein CKN99_13100 [Carnobacterium maltaromaticum]|jgi:predicted Mrr-cat superfamily restriction endonuclease|uniref:hypothetical protein n=1 Tax=Bacilli TaxID=91061 RepID=UPI00073B5866|nr:MULTISPECIES: hypothetical protein [Bacilli]EAE3172391.1 hypothetical protein [Listeria monocytogenes]KSZ47390.1 hypothetical protein AOA13_1612 [Listeria monocytogenes]MCF2042177.1 hypothetical protein [Listeria monocytogenes]MCF2073729.1 hypothetical protein [Listeria monocytogenes]MCG3338698.1 hypothetical protein [Listeria monocytogenes]
MSKPNYYLVRPYPNGVNRITEFKKRGCIGIGWSNLGDVSGKGKAELRTALESYFSASDQKKLRSTLGTFMIFCLDLKVGDYIIAPENKMGAIHVAQITSDYYYDASAVDLDFAHQREVKWLSETFSREAIAALNNERLVGALKFPGTAANLQEYHSELATLLSINTTHETGCCNESPTTNISQLVKASYPLRLNVYCDVSFPADMTPEEAQRFATFISTLSFNPSSKSE